MNLILRRSSFTADGIFGALFDENGTLLVQTLEHAYPDVETPGKWKPKVPPGEYTCVRGQHRLEGMDHDFETFEVKGVTGHSGILFHTGNWNKDSIGCILVGSSVQGAMLTASRQAFIKFLVAVSGLNTFTLLVKEVV